MERFDEFLKKTECCFNWGLSELEIRHAENITSALEYFKDRLLRAESSEIEDPYGYWPLRLIYAYELFKSDPTGASRKVDEVIEEIDVSDDIVTQKYKVPFLHIVRATKAFMLKDDPDASVDSVERVVSLIKPKRDMVDEELSGLFAMKAHLMRLYGPEGTYKSVPLLRKAVSLNSKEVEWSLSLVVSKNRIRHYLGGTELKWEDIEEPVNILKDLLKHPDISPQQTISSKYYLAVAYYDGNCRKKEMLELCEEIARQSQHAQILSFCAHVFQRSGNERKSQEIIEEALKKFPCHVGINSNACKFYKRKGLYELAAKHAKTAMDNGGYNAAWLLLQCYVAQKKDFDEEDFFNNLLVSFESLFVKQTHVRASMYYFCQKRNPIKGAYHMEEAIKENPSFKGLRESTFVPWIMKKVRPVELAYNQIVKNLGKYGNDEQLRRTKLLIESVASDEVEGFNITEDLVRRLDLGPRNYGRQLQRR